MIRAKRCMHHTAAPQPSARQHTWGMGLGAPKRAWHMARHGNSLHASLRAGRATRRVRAYLLAPALVKTATPQHTRPWPPAAIKRRRATQRPPPSQYYITETAKWPQQHHGPLTSQCPQCHACHGPHCPPGRPKFGAHRVVGCSRRTAAARAQAPELGPGPAASCGRSVL